MVQICPGPRFNMFQLLTIFLVVRRITPHVTNFSRFRLGTEKQEWKRKYKSDGGTMMVCM